MTSKAKSPDRRPSGWLTPVELARALDLSPHYVRTEVLSRVPDDAVRREGRWIKIYARVAIEAWLKYRLRAEVEREREVLPRYDQSIPFEFWTGDP
ncbi:hypothetical protein OAS39_00670 [Pirellulales bacterium]|nr:hypothetical protein [Pirellulales bacterium]